MSIIKADSGDWHRRYTLSVLCAVALFRGDCVYDMKLIRRWLLLPLYRYVYVPFADMLYRLAHRSDPPLPPVPCQICGGNHRERYCPKAREFGF
jgi:hypothetical protein